MNSKGNWPPLSCKIACVREKHLAHVSGSLVNCILHDTFCQYDVKWCIWMPYWVYTYFGTFKTSLSTQKYKEWLSLDSDYQPTNTPPPRTSRWHSLSASKFWLFPFLFYLLTKRGNWISKIFWLTMLLRLEYSLEFENRQADAITMIQQNVCLHLNQEAAFSVDSYADSGCTPTKLNSLWLSRVLSWIQAWRLLLLCWPDSLL